MFAGACRHSSSQPCAASPTANRNSHREPESDADAATRSLRWRPTLLSWRRNERALRMNLPLPAPLALPWLVTALVIVSVGLTVFAVTALVLSL